MENYKETEGVNQSTLKKILLHPSEYLKAVEKQGEPDSDEEHFVFGKLVDLMMYDPNKIKKLYLIADLPELGDKIKSVANSITETMELEGIKFLDEDSPASRNIVLECCKIHGYQSNWKPETVINKIFKEAAKYINILIKSKNKILISEDLHYKALNCKASLLSDKRTSKYFSSEFEKEFVIDKSKNVQIFKHFIVQYEYKEVVLKGELDELVINHKSKKIIPADLKTLGRKIYSFKSQFWKLRYDFQAATYMLGLRNHSEIVKLLEDGYELLNFRFIVVESNTTNAPLIYEVSPDVLEAGIAGGISITGYEYEGLNQAIDRYKYHKKAEQWDYPMEYENENLMIEL